MDDKEYYSLMRKQYSYKVPLKNTKNVDENEKTFTSLNISQGKDDAEMLFEKQNKNIDGKNEKY